MFVFVMCIDTTIPKYRNSTTYSNSIPNPTYGSGKDFLSDLGESDASEDQLTSGIGPPDVGPCYMIAEVRSSDFDREVVLRRL